MQDFNNSKDPVDFLQLSELCLDICNDKVVKLGDWTDRDVELFVSQFKEAELEPVIDMDKLDPNFYPRSYFANKFSGFDDYVIDALYECEQKKLQDMRMVPLRVYRDKVGTLAIENPTKEYNAVALQQDDKAEAQEAEEEDDQGKENGATKAETSPEADCYSSNRARWFKTAQEEEDDET
jgi:hypothetical protein